MMQILAAGIALHCVGVLVPLILMYLLIKLCHHPVATKWNSLGRARAWSCNTTISYSIESYMEVDNNDRGLSTSLYLCYIYLP